MCEQLTQFLCVPQPISSESHLVRVEHLLTTNAPYRPHDQTYLPDLDSERTVPPFHQHDSVVDKSNRNKHRNRLNHAQMHRNNELIRLLPVLTIKPSY